jgi:electron transfer flavoprotein beta subunit
MGADRSIQVIDGEAAAADGFRTAALLAAVVRDLGDVDLVLCGRQGSDFDQGTVPGVLAELLGAGLVTLAGNVAPVDGGVRVWRATPQGQEVVDASFPAVVSVSNEIGTPRYPTSRGMLEARRKPPEVRDAASMNVPAGGVEVVEVFVPDVQGHCEVIAGPTPAAKAEVLLERLAAAGVFDA